MPQVEIPIRDEFTNDEGRWVNYDAIPQNQREQLAKQKHVDLRSFKTALAAPTSMLSLDFQLMSDLNSETMGDLDGTTTVRASEQWTAGTVGKQADRHQWTGISLTCVVGTNTTSSVITVV